MKMSEVTLDFVKNYLRVDGDEDDVLLSAYLTAGIEYIKSYTGNDDIDSHEEVTIALLCIIADAYEVRQFTTSTTDISPVVEGILNIHCNNLIGGV